MSEVWLWNMKDKFMTFLFSFLFLLNEMQTNRTHFYSLSSLLIQNRRADWLKDDTVTLTQNSFMERLQPQQMPSPVRLFVHSHCRYVHWVAPPFFAVWFGEREHIQTLVRFLDDGHQTHPSINHPTNCDGKCIR